MWRVWGAELQVSQPQEGTGGQGRAGEGGQAMKDFVGWVWDLGLGA